MRIPLILCFAALLLEPAVASAGLIESGFETTTFGGLTQSGDLNSSLAAEPSQPSAIGRFNWRQDGYKVSASTASRKVSFGFYNRPDAQRFDDPAVDTAVPEPVTIWLAAPALLGLGTLRRRAA
jgi:hypothetical protein